MTFLFTDIEGSTKRWEADPDAMRAQLAAHDEVLRLAIEAQDGWLFKHTGDGVCAAFGSARAAVDAAVDAQRRLALPVRMGIATGEAEQRSDDYFGPALNRAARVMAVGHGGQILVSATTAAVVSGADLEDLGEHRLRDLAGVEHLFQVRADGLQTEFAMLRTVDAVPGNLPSQATSFVGRDREVEELIELIGTHRLVTLTGVGGVGKTRLAVQVAAEMVADFGDGAWLVELAPISDPMSVPDAVARALGITQQAGRTVTESAAEALAGRRTLIVMDNCEHVLDAAADLIEAIFAQSSTVTVIATSREGLRIAAEQLWPVPSLELVGAYSSAAVKLFIERAHAVAPGFDPDDEADMTAVVEICAQLDGIALAIELAAARMVSMTAAEVLGRLNDRFRLLSGPRRGLERHQTLRQAVQWSYELLTGDEQTVLGRCSVFADGLDLAAATAMMTGDLDEYQVLDLLDSLVRKSLVTAQSVDGSTRYALLETIRQFAEEQLAASGTIADMRDRHARWFATQAVAHWELWDSPRQRAALDWADAEFSNLRAGFRWAADEEHLETAVAIAAHAAMFGYNLMRYEPVEWVEELLPSATVAELPQLPRLYTAASVCAHVGRPDEAVVYACTATELETDTRYLPFDHYWSRTFEALAHLNAGRVDRWLEINSTLADEPGITGIVGLCGLTWMLPASGQAAQAREIADATLAAARDHGTPFFVAYALAGSGTAFTETEPSRALAALREGLAICRRHRLRFLEVAIAQQAAALEATHGDLEQGLIMFSDAIDTNYNAGDLGAVAATLAQLAIFFDRHDRHDVAATLYGATTQYPFTNTIAGLDEFVDQLRAELGVAHFGECVAAGSAIDLAGAVRYARHHMQLARLQLADRP